MTLVLSLIFNKSICRNLNTLILVIYWTGDKLIYKYTFKCYSHFLDEINVDKLMEPATSCSFPKEFDGSVFVT